MIESVPEIPSPLYDFSLNTIGTKVYLWGGMTQATASKLEDTASSSAWYYDLSKMPYTWYRMKDADPSIQWVPRSSHKTHAINSTSLLMIFGLRSYGNTSDFDYQYNGLKDNTALSVFNTVDGSIAPLQTTPLPGQSGAPTLRGGHSSIYDPATQSVWVYGGFDGKVVHDLWHLDLKSNTWTLMPAKGNIPGMGTSLEIAGKWLILCFGTDGYTVKPSNSCDLFDTAERKWVQPTLGTLPSARSIARMIAVPAKKQIYVFFGADYSEARIAVEDIWAMNTSSLPSVSWKRVPMSGINVPSPRMGHCVTLVNDRTIMLWGGRSSPQSNATDTTNYIFDTSTDTWIDPETDYMTIKNNDDSGEKIRFIIAGVVSISVLLLLFLIMMFYIRRRKESERMATQSQGSVERDVVPKSPAIVKPSLSSPVVPENRSETTTFVDTDSSLGVSSPISQTNPQVMFKQPLSLVMDANTKAVDPKTKLAMYHSARSPSLLDEWIPPWELKVANADDRP